MRLAIAYCLVTACVVAAFVARWRAMGEDERARAKEKVNHYYSGE